MLDFMYSMPSMAIAFFKLLAHLNLAAPAVTEMLGGQVLSTRTIDLVTSNTPSGASRFPG